MSYKALALGGISGLCIGGATISPPVTTLPFIITGSAAGYAAYEVGRKESANGWVKTGIDLANAIVTLGETGTGKASKKITIDGLPDNLREWLEQVQDDEDLTTPDFWQPSLAIQSFILAGSRGTGKSQVANWLFTNALAAGVDAKMSDRHYDRDDPEATEWCPGMSRDDFERKLLIETVSATLAAVTNLQRELQWRIDNKRRDLPKKHLFIDECNGFFSYLTDHQKQAVKIAIDFIMREGRKFGVNITLIFHDFTKEECVLGEGTRNQFHLMLTGDAISNTTWVIPAAVTNKRKQLLAEREAFCQRLSKHQRVIVYRNPVSGEVKVVVAPNFETDPLVCEVVDSDDELRQRVIPLLEQGKGITAIAQELNISRGGTGQYPKLQKIIAEVKQS